MDLRQLLKQTTIESTNESTTESTIELNDESTTESTTELTTELNDESTIELNDESTTELNDESTIDTRYQQPWNKLEKGVKMNRILVFVTQESSDKCLSDTLSKELKQILFDACDRGLFNKISDVSYNIELGIIESFKCLEFNESTKKYKLKSTGTKSRSVSKSRSNIDRLVKKK
jgi:hypothetical protein